MASSHQPMFYGYVIVAAAFLIQVIAWGINNSFGVFFNPLLTEFGWLRATISGAAALSFFVHGVGSVFMGGLNDRFGPRLIMLGCGLFLGSGYLLMAQVNTVWQLYLFYGLVVGIGQSGMDVVLLSTVARWFMKKRGMMSGVIKVGTGFGMVIMPVLITGLITAYGWRTSFFILGLIILFFIISLGQFLVRDPAGKRQFPDNEKSGGGIGLSLPEQGLALREAARTRQFWMVCGVYLIILFCVYTILLHIVQHGIDLGIPAVNAAAVLSIIGAASIGGRFIMGGAGDRIGHRNGLLVCLSFLLAGLLWLQLSKTLWMLYGFAVVYGFAHGGFFALGSPLVATLFGTRSHGLLFGILIFSGTIGGAIGPTMAGTLFDLSESYQFVFVILTALSGVGLVLTIFLRPINE